MSLSSPSSSCLLITTCDRTPLLRSSLERLATLTVPDEILVVDDGGTDGCEQACVEIARLFDVPLRMVYTHNPGDSQCSHARNVGIRSTDCDIVITSEPEIVYRTDVVRQMLDDHVTRPLEAINAGTVIHARQDGSPGESTVGWVAPYTSLYRRDWLLAIGGWDETFPDPWGWEDTDLLTRLRWSGIGQFVDTDIVAEHQWHPYRHCDQQANEAHFKAKTPERDLVANTGHGWGIPRPR